MVKTSYAFTMIELVFAIVIIGITALSLPMMTQATSKGMQKALEAQEGLYKAVVLTKYATVKDNTFASLPSAAVATKTAAQTGTGALEGYKFDHTYTLAVRTNTTSPSATFGGVTNAGIRQVVTTIYDESGNELIVLQAYKFNR